MNQAENYDEESVFRVWHTHLEKHLTMPFKAVIEEYQRGPLYQNDKVIVTKISYLDGIKGTMVIVKYKQEVYELPLCDLKAMNVDIQTQQLVSDYAVWFANR